MDSASIISSGNEADAYGPAVAGISWALVALIATGIVGLIVAAPLAQQAGHPGFAAAIYKSFSYVCHQIPERSFHLHGEKFAVCSRCTGLYSGLAVATLIYPVARALKDTLSPSLWWLVLGALPLAIDFSLGYFHIWANTHLTRFITGALLGSVAVFFILPGFIQMTLSIRRTARSH
ncbi:MAG: DUF2085 domain-containing protein [Pyrinomonadaceae bacterium]